MSTLKPYSFWPGPVDRDYTDLRGGEGVAIAVARHLASTADIMVADRLPPDNRHGVVQCVYVVIDGPHVNLQLKLLTDMCHIPTEKPNERNVLIIMSYTFREVDIKMFRIIRHYLCFSYAKRSRQNHHPPKNHDSSLPVTLRYGLTNSLPAAKHDTSSSKPRGTSFELYIVHVFRNIHYHIKDCMTFRPEITLYCAVENDNKTTSCVY